MKFIIEEKKASCFYARNCETGESVNIEKNDVVSDLLANTVIECEAEEKNIMGVHKKTLIVTKKINEAYAMTDKEKVLVDLSAVKLGDLIDDAPVMKFGQTFIKNGKKMCYGYFKV